VCVRDLLINGATTPMHYIGIRERTHARGRERGVCVDERERERERERDLLVHSMATLMNSASNPFNPILLRIPRCDPYVRGMRAPL